MMLSDRQRTLLIAVSWDEEAVRLVETTLVKQEERRAALRSRYLFLASLIVLLWGTAFIVTVTYLKSPLLFEPGGVGRDAHCGYQPVLGRVPDR